MKFGSREAVRAGWEAFKKNWKFFLLTGAVVLIFSTILNAVAQGLPDTLWPISLLVGLSSWFIGIVMSIGILKINIKAVYDEPLVLMDLYSHYQLFLKFLLAQFVANLASIVPVIVLAVGVMVFSTANGNVVLTVLGAFLTLVGLGLLIIVTTRLMFVQYFVVDREMGPADAVRASWNATRGEVVNLILFGVLLFLVVILGLLALVVGLVVAIPVTTLATAYVYKKLSSEK